MLIKQADSHTEEVRYLERLAASGGRVEAQHAAKDLAVRKAGIKGEAESAYLIDFHFSPSANWAVIHDLRIEFNQRVAQIDHLLINRFMECYVLETKHFRDGVKITEDGEFMRWNGFKHTFEGMPSPLEQNDRHIAVLRDTMKSLDLPTRLGMRIQPTYQSLVLVSPTARIDRPKKFDAGRVIKADQLHARIKRDADDEGGFGVMKSLAKVVSSDSVRVVAQQLVELHRPVTWKPPFAAVAVLSSTPPDPSIPPAKEVDPTEMAQSSALGWESVTQSSRAGPTCKECKSADGNILHGKYGYYFQCAKCGANTAIRFTCQTGHMPRLRKAGNQFYRECAECGTSDIYFINT